MLKFEKITKKYRKKTALQNISLEIPERSCIGLVGPNGSGKSTLLNMIAGLVRPTQGEITYNEIPLKTPDGDKRKAGYAIQDFQLHRNRTLKEEMSYLIELAGIDHSIKSDYLQKFLEKSKLEGQEKKKIKELSFGNLQKLNIFQAQLNDPEILLLDEPFVSLDFNKKKEIKNQIRSIKEKKITFISSHNLSDIMELCDHFIFLNQGVLIRFIQKEILLSNFCSISVYTDKYKHADDFFNKNDNVMHEIIDKINGKCRFVVEKENRDLTFEKIFLQNGGLSYLKKSECTLEDLYQYFIK